jgi:biopolymer transport protein ExbD
MAIFAPGRRDRHNRPLRGRGRSVVAMLSLTAMVDMFTVVAVFLLQNYQTTGEVIELSENVALPKAHAVRELKPAHVVVVSHENIILDKDIVASFASVKEQQDWRIEPLAVKLAERFKESEDKRSALAGRVQQAVEETRAGTKNAGLPEDPADDRRVTVQADKSVDFLTVKKVMLTLTEVGASEINFAVIKEETKTAQ